MSKDDSAVEEVVQDASTASATENNVPEVAEDDEIMEATLDELDPQEASDGEEETEGSEEVAPSDTEETNPEPQPQGEQKPLAPKSENRFQKLANENRELKERLERLQTQESQVATEQELLNEVNPETGDYYTPMEAERIARQQALEAQAQSTAQERYQLEVMNNQMTIRSEAEKALTDFPMFDQQSPNYKPELAAQADQLLGQSLIFNEQGVLVGSNLSPYQIYKTVADAAQANSAQARAEAQKATEKMLANADSPGGASNASKPKVDPDLEAFDSEASTL